MLMPCALLATRRLLKRLCRKACGCLAGRGQVPLGQGRAIAWLLGIVHHKALNQVRGRVIDLLEAESQDLPAKDPLPDEQVAVREQRLVRAGLERLSPEHRLALELVFYQGLSLNEAAEACGCPAGTIKSRLNYAKASLRGVLSRAGLRG